MIKVRTYKTVEIDCDVEVSIEDVLDEFGRRIDEDPDKRWLLSTLDWITRMLARVPGEAIEGLPAEGRTILCERLMTEAGRYDPAP